MGWRDLIGWVGTVVVVVSLLQTGILRLRLLNLVGSSVLLVFNVLIQVWPMVGLNAVLALINIVQLRKLLTERHDDGAYTVLEVGGNDAYLRHVIATHGADIARFNPGFTIDSIDEHTLAFLVQRSDRTAGVVLAHGAGLGRAQIDLDYVLPAYRDFTPGEFVYRRSDVFARHGIVKVAARRDMQHSDAYLTGLGFRSEGSDLVLELTG